LNVRSVARLLLVAGCTSRVAHAQSATPTFSIGQPPQWQQEASAVVPLRGRDGIARLSYGVHHPIANPLTGIFGLTGEAYANVGADGAGIRAFAQTRTFGLSAGLDWDVAASDLAPILAFQTAIRRGGLVGRGTMARLEWLPTRSHSLALGLTVPMFQPLAGRTRPKHTTAQMPSAEPVARRSDTPSGADFGAVRAAANTIAAFSNTYSDRAAQVIQSGSNYARAVASYQSALHGVFASAVGDSTTAQRLVRRGRTALLDHVFLPYDSLFGRSRSDSRDLSRLFGRATNAVRRWLDDSTWVAAPSKGRALAAYGEWMDVVAEVHRDLLTDAGDSRLVWLPLDLALTADEFDEQLEVDSLLARAVGHPFTDRNGLTYLRSTDLPLEIARSIYAAREYHVMWMHDFTGRRESGAIDNVGFSMVADAYLPALTAAVKRYDSTGVLPSYIILQDQFFYEPRGNRLWMNILGDPLHASMRLRGDSGAREAHLRDRQDELRAAVAASRRLQREAAASGNADRWLRRIVKVSVNIVEPADFSFRSHRTIPGIPFTPDNIMRDHRKIVFYDLNETDPYRGALLLMGVGIGEHYASATWEDRGYRVRGPATLEARRSIREALRRNGFAESDIPLPLRETANLKAAEQRMDVRDYVGRALQVHNEVGFARKESSVARALLYNLAPPGSVIIAPDPMWLSATWAGMLAGAAARGSHVYVVAPAKPNTPSPQAPLVALQRDVIGRLIELRTTLGGRIRGSHGDLRIGLFAATAHVDDASGRAREIRAGLARAPWIREIIPFDDKTLSVLEQAERQVANGVDATTLARDEEPRAPQLHQKSQLIARPGAIAALVRQSGWDDVLARTIRVQAQQTARFTEQFGYATPDVDTAAVRASDAVLRGYEQSIPENERKRLSFYFSVGTQNQDSRGIVSDAETTLLVSGIPASAGLVDLYFLMARSTWIETPRELDALVPPPSAFWRRLGRLLAAAF
jgi:hypothetical protein